MSTYNGRKIIEGEEKYTREAIKKKKTLNLFSLTSLQKVSVFPCLWLYNKVKMIYLSVYQCLVLNLIFLFINLLSKSLLGCLDNLGNVGYSREKVKSDACWTK